jgi:uncharacterized protein YndB with AHSA1/START domain
MPTIEKSVVIDKPVPQVWAFLADLKNTPQWDVGVTETRVTSDGPLGLGTTFENVGMFLGRYSIREYQVTEFEPNQRVTVDMSAPPGFIRHGGVSYAFEPEGAGTKLTATARLELRGLFKLLQPMMMRRGTRDFEGDLANLKRLLEGQ